MTIGELRLKYERLLAEVVPGTMLPAVEVYRLMTRELAAIEVTETMVQLAYDTRQAARLLGVAPKTVAHWCEPGRNGEPRRFPNAMKTGHKGGGKWTIPAADIERYLADRRKEGAAA